MYVLIMLELFKKFGYDINPNNYKKFIEEMIIEIENQEALEYEAIEKSMKKIDDEIANNNEKIIDKIRSNQFERELEKFEQLEFNFEVENFK